MTCIQLVPAIELPDQFLFIEYRILPTIINKVRNHVNNGKKISDLKIPKIYLFGKGHQTFFYDKLKFIKERHFELAQESLRRGFNIKNVNPLDISDIPVQWCNSYVPQFIDIQSSRDMLNKWINETPDYYRWTSSTKPSWIK